jgi:hypothetical protein
MVTDRLLEAVSFKITFLTLSESGKKITGYKAGDI